MLRLVGFYLIIGIGHNFPWQMRPKMEVPPGGSPYSVSFTLENCDQPSELVVTAVYYARNFFILPWLWLSKIKKLLA